MEIHVFSCVSALLISLVLVVNAQHQQQSYESQQYDQRPKPVILMHKQALSTDGAFNYAFTADNGLQQGESISPDGTRRGAYSYVDPNGKKISVKYTAGKDGFKILEGDHVPKPVAPIAAAPAPRPSPYQGAPAYTTTYQGASPNALYRGQDSGYQSPYYKVQDNYDNGVGSPAHFRTVYQSKGPATFQTVEQRHTRPVVPQQSSQYNSNARLDEEGRQEPHSFGSGYAFEFAG